MRKVIISFILCLLFIPRLVLADNIYSIDMDVYLTNDGKAEISQVWDAKADSGSEWYIALYNLSGSSISDYRVYMDGEELTYKTWNIDEDINSKKGYYGINYVSEGIELCFGKSDFKEHTFKIEYTINNAIVNTSDSQIFYWTLIPRISANKFYVEVTSYYDFLDTLDVWGYGYDGYAYVNNGKIVLTSDSSLDSENVILLVKFPLNTFNSNYTVSGYDSFDDFYNTASEGASYNNNSENISESIIDRVIEGDAIKYNGDNKIISFIINIINKIIMIVVDFSPAIIFTLIIVLVAKLSKIEYGYENKKIINKKDIPYYRDIPCNKDIYYMNALIKMNNFNYVDSNILGAIILKWVKEDKIRFIKVDSKKSTLDLTNGSLNLEGKEKDLFDMMYNASDGGYLKQDEFNKWAKKNYSKFLDLLGSFSKNTISELKSKGLIRKTSKDEKSKYNYILNDILYDDSCNLYGSYKFLKDFSNVNTKEVLDVKLLDEYLMIAYLFGISKNIIKQLEKLYPTNIVDNKYDYNDMWMIYYFSDTTVRSASSARAAAESYSAGGGGFSSSGGGGGSFGGGGSAGGR